MNTPIPGGIASNIEEDGLISRPRGEKHLLVLVCQNVHPKIALLFLIEKLNNWFLY